jgi:hypothetical protein
MSDISEISESILSELDALLAIRLDLPNAWTGIKVVYIPKSETKDPVQPKSYRSYMI